MYYVVASDSVPSKLNMSLIQNFYIFVLWLLWSMLLYGCAAPINSATLKFGMASAPVDLDPRRATDAASTRVNRLLYRRLVEFDAADRPVPGLADWIQPAPNRYIFRLLNAAEGRVFSNGHALTAEDVRATFASILDPVTGSPYRSQLASIVKMQVINTAQIEIDITRPDPLFPTRLVLEILPADLLAAGHPFHNQPVGSGPFKFTAWPQSGRLQLTRRADGQALELLEVKNPGVRVMKLLRGEINLLQNDLPPELFRFLRGRPGIQVMQRPGSNFTYIGLNMQDPALSKLAVRQALAHAIDLNAIIRYLLNGGDMQPKRCCHRLIGPEPLICHPWCTIHSLPVAY